MFHVLAENELLEGTRFYLAISPELGSSFVSDVERSTNLLGRHPDVGKFVAPGVRSFRLSKFPYSLYYRASNERLEILAVGHQRRRPLYWKSRA
jgi:plasmid stabilization system protein ParE